MKYYTFQPHLLPIHGVMCSVTGARVQADVFGLRPRLVFGGGTLHIITEYAP